MTGDLLSVEKVCSWYGQAQVLWDVHLQVAPGEGVGIIGRNGAGKTTLLRTIACVHPRTSGDIALLGESIAHRPAHDVARRGLSFVREGAPVFADLSVLENIKAGLHLAELRRRAPLPVDTLWDIFPVLQSMRQRRAGLLSGGQRQMLALATALASSPSVLLLDEPSAGLAPGAAQEAFTAIGRMRESGLCVVIAEQNREWLQGITSRSLELESGHMVTTLSEAP